MKRQSGAGLIEALISILILSIGLMGMIGMQTAAFRYEQTGWLRSSLASNISSVADRIRANIDSADADYTFTSAYTAERTRVAADGFPIAVDCGAVTCTPAQLAAYDLMVWRRDLNTQLPGAVGLVVPTGTRGIDLRYTVTVAWYDKDNLNDESPQVLASPNMCAANTAGIAARNCCPAVLGTASSLTGLRCTNLEIIP